MFRKIVKKLPVVSLVHKNVVLSRHIDLAEKQLNNAVELIARAHQDLLESRKLENSSNIEQDFVVSLTSYGTRVANVHHTVLSLLCQSVMPTKVYLWLSDKEFNDQNIPKSLKALVPYGLEIRFCKDTRSYKKLVPALSEFPTKRIITFDDDVVYPLNHIERLLVEAEQYPNTVICHLAHHFPISKRKPDGQLPAYSEWQREISSEQPSPEVYPVGVGGVLYPVDAFDKDVLKENVFQSICPYADDVWFKLMALKNGTLSKVVTNPTPYEEYLHTPETQEVSLWQINTSQNDVQLNNVINKFSIDL